MAYRVHPNYTRPGPRDFKPTQFLSSDYSQIDSSIKLATSGLNSNSQFAAKALPPRPPGTYVVQIPKDEILPPDNTTCYKQRVHKRVCCCVVCTLALLAVLILLSTLSATILYLVFRPKTPLYSVQSISFANLNLTKSSLPGPRIDITIRAENRNEKVEIYYYTKGSSVDVHYHDVRLCNGVFPTLKQGTRNVTQIMMALRNNGPGSVDLPSLAHNMLRDAQGNGTVPLRLDLRVPVKLKARSVKTWMITIKVNCDFVVDRLTIDAKILSIKCLHGIDVLGS